MARQCDHNGCGKCSSCGACGYQTAHYPNCKIHGYDVTTGAPKLADRPGIQPNEPIPGDLLVAFTKEQAEEHFGKPHRAKAEQKILRYMSAREQTFKRYADEFRAKAPEDAAKYALVAQEIGMLAHDIAMGRHNGSE